MNGYKISKEEMATVFTEWERRWREEPEKFQDDMERLASSEEEYGVGASEYFIELFLELKGEEPQTTEDRREMIAKKAGLE